MESKKIVRHVNVGGELGAAAEDAMTQAGMSSASQMPEDAVVINNAMLPSKGICYGGKQLYITPLTSKNLKDLNTMTEETANATLNNVLAERIGGIDHRDILQGDKIWLIFYLRAVTYDDFPIFMKYNCPDCKRADVYKMRMADLNVNCVKEDFDFKLKLPKSNDLLTLRFPTLGHEAKGEKLKNDTNIIEAVDPELVDVSLYIAEVNGESLTTYEAYNYTKNMKALDFAAFTNNMIDNNIGLNPIVEIPCACGTVVSKRIGFTPDFFMPKFDKYQA